MNVKLLMCDFNGYGNGININMLVTEYYYNAILIIYDTKTKCYVKVKNLSIVDHQTLLWH